LNKNLLLMLLFGLPGLIPGAIGAGGDLLKNPMMLMMLMGGRMNMQTMLMMMMLQGSGGATMIGTGTTAQSLLPLMLLSQSSGRRYRRTRRPQAIRVYNSRRY